MGARFATPPSGMPIVSGVDVLWLGAFNRVSARVAHELKGALNGVSVNLEVVRSRAEKPDSPASAVKTYANSAVAQFDIVIDMSAALLVLAREPRSPVEIASTLRNVVTLLERSAKADGRALELEGSLDDLGATSAEGNAARLAIAECLLAAIDSSPHVVAGAVADDAGVTVKIESRGGAELRQPDRAVVDALRDAGIRIQAVPSAISISFPR